MTGFPHGTVLSASTGRAALTRAMVEPSILAGRDNAAAVEAAQFFSPHQAKPNKRGEMMAGCLGGS